MALDLSNNVLVYTVAGVVYIILVVIIYFFIQHKARKLAKKMLEESLEEKGYRLENNPEHSKKPKIEKKVVDEVVFFAGLVMSMAGFMLKNYMLLLAGILVSILSVFVLHFMLKSGRHSLMSAIKESEEHVRPVVISRHDKADITQEEKEMLRSRISPRRITVIKGRKNEKKSDIAGFLKIADNLLEKLPEHEISSFASSSEFEIYRKLVKDPPESFNGDLKKLCPVIDSLLGKLPKEEISRFSKSKEFRMYENIMDSAMKNGAS